MEDIIPFIRFPVMNAEDIGKKVSPMGLLSNAQVLDLFTYMAKVSAGLKPKLGKSLKFGNKVRKGREPPTWFRWDKKLKHSSIQLSDDRLTVKSTATTYQPIFGDTVLEKGISEWEIQIDTMYSNTYSLNIGVVPAKSTGWSSSQMIGYSGHVEGWAYACGHGQKYHQTQTSYGKVCSGGDVVKVRMNCDKKELEFFLNDKSLGIAYTGITLPVRPAMSLYGTNSVTLQFPRVLTL